LVLCGDDTAARAAVELIAEDLKPD
jgi:hypothetical protein